ncbi:hypothetical protein R3W88_020224 [Solanum pinnatisectum]|uniref:Uncharacterized protein n=1 Tax=Solanum pinnatisectum TaxID=50273 RepID=A0AAV9KMM6_9SOLN|nr:hypothetical protein R3W88_020224 [Solanum pinnatisectum]
MSMTMFAVKVKEGKEGKNGQPSIGLVYRHPIDSGLLITGKPTKYKEVNEEILQTGSALGAHGIEHFHIGFCTVAAAALPIFFKGKFLTLTCFGWCTLLYLWLKVYL